MNWCGEGEAEKSEVTVAMCIAKFHHNYEISFLLKF